MNKKLISDEQSSATVTRGGAEQSSIKTEGYYKVECRDSGGNVKWKDEIHNLVTTVGKNDILDKYLKGSTYTQTVRMGLKGAGSTAAGDTMASHAGWSEVGGTNAPAYTGNRKDVTMGSASGGSSVSPAQVFAITSSGTIAGCFICNGGSATKDDTTGILYSVGDFTGGSKTVASSDSISVTWTATVS